MNTHPALVAVRLPPGPAFLAAVEDVWSRGDAVLPLSTDRSDAAVGAIVRQLRPHRMLSTEGERAAADDPLEVPAGTALVVVTSGTTGTPKGVVLGHDAVRASVASTCARLGCEHGERWLACLPLSHVAGVSVLLRARHLGTDPVIHEGFTVAAVADADVEYLSLVPTMLVRLLDAGVDLARFRSVLVGGAAPGAALLERAAAAGARVVVSYGMTETCGGCVYDGRPLDGVDVAVGDDGRIAIRGPVLFDGYHGRPDLTAAVRAAGWLLTNDRGREIEDGRLEVLGRLDDVVVSGGENVSLSEVEDLLRGHPKVRDAAASGRPDREWGQRVTATIVPVDPADPPSLDELRRYVKARASRAHAPGALEVVAALQRGPLGKVRRDPA